VQKKISLHHEWSVKSMLTPFSDLKTNEMPIKKIVEYFVPPKNIDKIYTSNAAFIEGQRGTGKTTLMRYISNHLFVQDGIIKYIGVYLRFDRTTYSSEILSKEECSDVFSHYITTVLLIKTMRQIKAFFSEKDFVSFDAIVSAITYTYYCGEKIDSIDGVLSFLERHRLSVAKYIRNRSTVIKPEIADYSGCFERLVEAFHNEPKFSDLNILFLLDEFENLNGTQQSVINAFIKAMEYGYSFKVFHRPLGRENAQVLDSREYLKDRDDYVVLDFYDDIIGGDEAFPEFVKDMCRKRLQYYYTNEGIAYQSEHLEISSYLENFGDDDEFATYNKKKKYVNRIRHGLIESISKYQEEDINQIKDFIDGLDNLFQLRLFQMLIAKLRMHPLEIIDHFVAKSAKYENWVHNYKKSILYLVCYENDCNKQISGIHDIISLSGSITRYVLNILHYIFINDNDKKDCISVSIPMSKPLRLIRFPKSYLKISAISQIWALI